MHFAERDWRWVSVRDVMMTLRIHLRSDRREDGRCYSPASRDARAVMRLTALYSTRYALTARTKQYGVNFALFGVRRLQLSEASTILRG
jgi:hypothetical protein